MENTPSALTMLVGLAWIIFFVFMFRSLLCWFFKINEVISLLKEVKVLLGEKPESKESLSIFSLAAVRDLRDKLMKNRSSRV